MTDLSLERIKSLEQRLAKEPQSPLFARLADSYLQAGRANDALRLCDDGLALYPNYTTAHLIKAKVLLQLGMTAEARHAYEVVREFLPTNESVIRLTSIVDGTASAGQDVNEAVEEIAEPEPTQAPAQELEHEEIVIQESQPTTPEAPQATLIEEASPQEVTAIEEPVVAAEEPQVQNFVPDEPQTVEPEATVTETENPFGFGEQQVAETQPEESGAAEKPGLDLAPEQQPYADFDFGAPAEQPSVAAVEETPFGSQSIEEPAPIIEQVPEPSPLEAPAMAAAPVTPEPVQEATPETNADATSDWLEAFSQLQQPEAPSAEPPSPAPAEEENPFAMFGTEETSATVEGEPFDEFTARVRMELFGTEDTMTLDEYLAQTGTVDPPIAPPDNIEDLAEKLKASPRITPPVINFSEKASRSASEVEAGGGSGFVTPTLAEIYVKQGWFDDAIKAYRALAANKPAEKEKFEQRITEIEEMKKK